MMGTLGPHKAEAFVGNEKLSISPASQLRDATVDKSYNAQITISGGRRPYTISVWGVTNGLSYKKGVDSVTISGTPKQAGSLRVKVTVKDATGYSTTNTLTINIIKAVPNPPSHSPTPRITPTRKPNPSQSPKQSTAPTPPPAPTLTPIEALKIKDIQFQNGKVGQAYKSSRIEATGGIEPYTFEIDGLPNGLKFENGHIVGVPSIYGEYLLNVSVLDSRKTEVSLGFPLTILSEDLIIATRDLPVCRVGDNYSAKLAVSGGIAPYKLHVSGLPAGLSIVGGDTISGIPKNMGNFRVLVYATDSLNNRSKDKELVIKVYSEIKEPKIEFTIGKGKDYVALNNAAIADMLMRAKNYTKQNSLSGRQTIAIMFEPGTHLIKEELIFEDAGYDWSLSSGIVGAAALNADGNNSLMYIDEKVNINFTGIVFTGGYSKSYGGAVYIKGFTIFVGCTFSANKAKEAGGAIYSEGVTLIENCRFYKNSVVDDIGGGAIFIRGDEAWLNIGNTVFDGNMASGGMGGAIYISEGASAALNNCGLNGNTAALGGAFGIDGGGLAAESCVFKDNSARINSYGVGGRGGAAVFFSNSIATLRGCIFIGNKATLGRSFSDEDGIAIVSIYNEKYTIYPFVISSGYYDNELGPVKP